MDRAPRYATNVAKVLEVILWVARHLDVPDVYRAVKAIYYADLYHVQTYGRPVAGEAYEADQFGPLAQVAYGIIRGKPIEMIALGHNGPLPFTVDTRHLIKPVRDANDQMLSESDQEALWYGIEQVKGKTFDQIFEETHQHVAYQAANGGRMDYRLFIPQDDPDWKEKADYLSESAPYIAL